MVAIIELRRDIAIAITLVSGHCWYCHYCYGWPLLPRHYGYATPLSYYAIIGYWRAGWRQVTSLATQYDTLLRRHYDIG